MKKKIILILSALGLMLAINSCSKKLDLAPVSSISDANFWQTPDQVDAFVAGIHTAFRNNVGAFESLGEMRADIFGTDPGSSSAFTGEATQGLEKLWTNNLDANNPGVSNFGNFYFNINQINLLIKKLNTTNLVTPANKNYYLGIGYGMRAFYYFQLYRSWGNVIIQTEPVVRIDSFNLAKPASSADSVMALIKSDIDNSVNSFGSDYSFRQQKGYWCKSATLMLKANVYLWTSYRAGGTADATVAENALTDIQTNVSGLSLLPSYANVFASSNRGNSEIIFASRDLLNEANLPFANTFFPQAGLLANFYDSLNNRKFNVATDNWGGLLRAPVKISTYREFSDLDSRKFVSIQAAYNKVGGTYQIAGAFANKYQGEQSAGARVFTNDYPIYRYADLLLLKAEAEVILGQDPTNEINLVRARAYGSNYNAATIGYPNQEIDADPKEAILQERFYEFIFEGKRWYDLRRMGDQYVYQFTNITPNQSYKLLWPIDRSTLTNNPALKQNPGYPAF
ncbi:MAG TPA: SusD family outer membrane lipoprotein NanU [Hanamia sp.]|jgi:starch-binding outer membrane protein, SusD/RagB family|nr:SusD family outer membrane lipoprotein NanU [Hanamia sp.]